MVQDQLVEYISTQLKLGVSRDAIKSALTGVGWVSLDVEDTLKKVEGATTPASAQPTVAPKMVQPASSVAAAAPAKFVSFSMPGTVASPTKNSEPQTVRVSDLVSTVAPASGMSSSSSSPKIISSGPAKIHPKFLPPRRLSHLPHLRSRGKRGSASLAYWRSFSLFSLARCPVIFSWAIII